MHSRKRGAKWQSQTASTLLLCNGPETLNTELVFGNKIVNEIFVPRALGIQLKCTKHSLAASESQIFYTRHRLFAGALSSEMN